MTKELVRTGLRRSGRYGRRARTAAAALAVAAVTGTCLASASSVSAAEADPSVIECPTADKITCVNVAHMDGGTYAAVADSQGRVYAIDKNGVLWEKESSSESIRQLATGLGQVTSVAFDEDGRTLYYATDSTPAIVKKVSLDAQSPRVETVAEIDTQYFIDGMVLQGSTLYLATGEQVRKMDIGAEAPQDEKVVGNLPTDRALVMEGDALYVIHDEALWKQRIDKPGYRAEKVADLGHDPYGLVRDGAGNFFYLDNGDLYRLPAGSAQPEKVATGLQAGYDSALTMDSQGNLYLGNDAGAVWRLAGVGEPVGGGGEPDDPYSDLEISDVPHVWTVAGRNAVPRVKVTNTGSTHVGKEDVTLKLGPSGVRWAHNVVYWEEDGQTVQTQCTEDTEDATTSHCPDVNLDLDPGESIELRTEVGTSEDLRICEFPSVTWEIAGETGRSTFVVKDKDGNPAQC